MRRSCFIGQRPASKLVEGVLTKGNPDPENQVSLNIFKISIKRSYCICKWV